MSKLRRVLTDAAIDRMIAAVEDITGQPEVIGEDDSAEREMIQLAAFQALYAPVRINNSRLLDSILTWRRRQREAANPKKVASAQKKLAAAYAEWCGWPAEIADMLPASASLPLSLDVLDGELDDAESNELAGRPPRSDNYTEILLIVYRRLFGKEPKASLARARLPGWGGLEDSGAAVYFIEQFEREIAALIERRGGSRFKPRKPEHIRDHIAALI